MQLHTSFGWYWVRKVRTPKSRPPGNAWARKRDGKCHRKDTACIFDAGKGEKVR
jgi:hypothetical protein